MQVHTASHAPPVNHAVRPAGLSRPTPSVAYFPSQSPQLPPQLLITLLSVVAQLLQQLQQLQNSGSPDTKPPACACRPEGESAMPTEPAVPTTPGGSTHGSPGSYSPDEQPNDPFLADRRNISIYGDTTKNRLVVMSLENTAMIQQIPLPGAENVYSVDTVAKGKDYITPRGSDFIQVLNRNADGRFEPGERIDLAFKPRTPNRNDANGLVLYSGADKPMWALIDVATDKVVAQGGRNEVTQETFDNYDSQWATGHAQWVSDSQFLLPDRQTNEIALYAVKKQDDGSYDVQKSSAVTLSGSVHTFFGTKVQSNGDVLTYAPGEGTDPVNNTDANLYELKIAADQLSVNRSVRTQGGLHHPGGHPDGKVIYAPTSNGTVDVIDRDSFQVVKSIPAGKGAGHVTFIPERDLALITNHSDGFVTAINTLHHSLIKQIPVTTDNPDVDNSLQAHTGRVSEDKRYFYNFATDQGTFFRIDLDSLVLDKSFFTGGTPKQATQPGELI